ncbi:MAG: rod shape-determining protein MreC, partial [Xanthomonadaceae bacterium]|nr:rod shape-determining protein MreC [Xanthomonadaceae bacterium]
MPSFAGSPAAVRPGETANTLRLLGYLALAVMLIVFDKQAGWLSQVRQYADRLTQPVWALAGLPGRLGVQLGDN